MQRIIRVKNLDAVITAFKPPIFWKDKEIVKQQISSWSYNQAEDLIYEINEIELLIKKYPHNSINILSNFIIEKLLQLIIRFHNLNYFI